MIVNKIFSWQESIWESLLAQPANLPHAMLFIGPAGTGKGLFADQLAARLLCESAQGSQPACGICDGCHLLATDNHPDFRKITLESDVEEEEGAEKSTAKSKKKSAAPAMQIKIDQIRALEDFVFVGSHRQGKRVVVINPADAMNVAATNSLLKILEEPPSSVYFLLVSSNSKRLLPTLRSRCRQMLFGIPNVVVASAWLKAEGVREPEQLLGLAGGAPLKALALKEEGSAAVVDEAIEPLYRPPLEPIALAAHWEALRKKNPGFLLEHLIDAVQKWLYDLTRVRNGSTPRYLPDSQKELLTVAPKISVARLNRCYADLLKIRATARHPLNELLFLEDLAARCAAALSLPRS
ncbi:DNA-directed DNA polymerase III, delta subunit [Georgfuchsia toluolica]|uniref:DNA-directed DNA polymerase III, delta subunit n=1 Tax=Georgfuchsia toluolica TaxID=424218 RepID=A0A916J5J6_9PROT|nr:DNA polymerase III subunit delta' [Georgfuchsia toluolica]CAG4882844.1 DNA-directed DNA polymerase III, delta subunit [Georgfuchsia toluolica]